MNRWANNYYTQQVGKDHSPRHQQLLTAGPPFSRSRRNSFVKTGVANLLVFRVAHLTQLTLRSLIERQGVQVLNIEQVSHKGAGYKSFMVSVEERDAPKLLSRSFWPGLVACRPLQDVDPWHNDVFSRRWARELPLPASNSEDNSRDTRVGRAQPCHLVVDKPRMVHSVASRPHGTQNISERKEKPNRIANSNNLKDNEKGNDKKPNKPQKEKIQTSTKNCIDEKRPKTLTHKGNKSARVPTRTIKVKHKSSDGNAPKRHVPKNTEHGKPQPVTHRSTRTRKPNITNSLNVGKNRKQKPDGKFIRKNSKSEGISDNKEISNGRLQPEKSTVTSVPSTQVSSSYLTTPIVNKKYKNVHSSTNLTHDSKYTVYKPKVTQSNWVTPLRGLLSMSSEEALSRLLGPVFDRLLTQYNVMDEEIFLGVRVLAHCARAKTSPNKLQQLVYKICQPQVVYLIKEFTRTVEKNYKGRAERYFWDLGEFLDLYIVHNIFLQGMLSLFTACLAKILALNSKKYVSDDLVKVYRGMQTKVFANLP